MVLSGDGGAVLRSAAEGDVAGQPEALYESALRLPHGTND